MLDEQKSGEKISAMEREYDTIHILKGKLSKS